MSIVKSFAFLLMIAIISLNLSGCTTVKGFLADLPDGKSVFHWQQADKEITVKFEKTSIDLVPEKKK